MFSLLKFAHGLKFFEHPGSMGGIVVEFIRKVLTGPVLVMATTSPQSAFTYIINNTFIGHPNLFFVLPISKGQLGACVRRQQLKYVRLKLCIRTAKLIILVINRGEIRKNRRENLYLTPMKQFLLLPDLQLYLSESTQSHFA